MSVKNLLRSATKGEKSALSDVVIKEIHALNGPRPLRFLTELALAWVVIIGAISWAMWVGTWWASLAAILVIATRHNVLGLLVHEQTHRLGLNGRFGNLFVNLFAAYPLLVLTVEGYARVHLAHHRDFFSERDPDHLRKSGEDWEAPMPRRQLARLFLTDLLGVNTIKLIRGKKDATPTEAIARSRDSPKWVRPLYFGALGVALTITQNWTTFLVYWALPILTVSQVIVRWGALCEHKYNAAGASVAEATPLIVLRWWERFLLPNLNFSMHPYHHYFPGVAFGNLPRVHQIYLREGLIDHDAVFHGYWTYLRFLTRPTIGRR